MTARYVHRCLIIPADLAPLARHLCEEMAGPAGAGMFQTALSPSGQKPATHYVSSGMIETHFADILADANLLFDAFEGQVPLAAFEDILARSDVSQEPPYTAMNRLGLQIILPDDEDSE